MKMQKLGMGVARFEKEQADALVLVYPSGHKNTKWKSLKGMAFIHP